MEKYDVVLNTKELRKAAFAVGFGLFMGKEVAKTIDTFAGLFLSSSLKHAVDKLVADGPENEKKMSDESENSKEEN